MTRQQRWERAIAPIGRVTVAEVAEIARKYGPERWYDHPFGVLVCDVCWVRRSIAQELSCWLRAVDTDARRDRFLEVL